MFIGFEIIKEMRFPLPQTKYDFGFSCFFIIRLFNGFGSNMIGFQILGYDRVFPMKFKPEKRVGRMRVFLGAKH